MNKINEIKTAEKKIKYIDKLLEFEDSFDDYLDKIEKLDSPNIDFSEQILGKISKENTIDFVQRKNKYSVMDILKVACFAIVITFLTSTLTSNIYAVSRDVKKEVRKENNQCDIRKKMFEFNTEFRKKIDKLTEKKI